MQFRLECEVGRRLQELDKLASIIAADRAFWFLLGPLTDAEGTECVATVDHRRNDEYLVANTSSTPTLLSILFCKADPCTLLVLS
jgi:hypothetical protein